MIPDYQTIMLPLLGMSSDGEEHGFQEAVDNMVEHFDLSTDERKRLLPSGRKSIISNRVGWAKTYMSKAGLLDTSKRGYFRITQEGLDVIAEKPEAINVKYLNRFPGFRKFRERKSEGNGEEAVEERDTNINPEEALEDAYMALRGTLGQEILEKVKSCSPAFFEKLVVELLVNMGYGGSRKDAGEAIGRSGDEGIDGIIKEDRLGLDVIYIQAKRWENTVGRPEIQKFVGALQGKRAKKGVFITTANFSNEALTYARDLDLKVVLIDGDQLVENMIDFDIGVSLSRKFDMKKIDLDYFEEA